MRSSLRETAIFDELGLAEELATDRQESGDQEEQQRRRQDQRRPAPVLVLAAYPFGTAVEYKQDACQHRNEQRSHNGIRLCDRLEVHEHKAKNRDQGDAKQVCLIGKRGRVDRAVPVAIVGVSAERPEIGEQVGDALPYA